MPTTKNYRDLHDEVAERRGATERLAELREHTLAEIGLFDLRRHLDMSQVDLAAELGISQSAVSQLEHAGDLKVSTLRNYLARMGARLELVAVFDDDAQEFSVPIRVGDATST
ncbi:MAG: helix-turn-helix domain-containing protein [Acidimicrobiia bacterium]